MNPYENNGSRWSPELRQQPPIKEGEQTSQYRTHSATRYIESIPQGQPQATGLSKRDCRDINQVASELEKKLKRVLCSEKRPDQQEYCQLIGDLDLLRKNKHSQAKGIFSRFCFYNIIPIPANHVKNYAETPDSCAECLKDLVELRTSQKIRDKDLDPAQLKTALLALNSLNHPNTDKLLEQAETLFTFRKKTESDGLFRDTMAVGRAQRMSPPSSPKLARHDYMKGMPLLNLKSEAKIATKAGDHEKAFFAYYQLAKLQNEPIEVQKAWLEMTQLCLVGDVDRSKIPPDVLVKKLNELAVAGNLGARFQLESLAQHEHAPYRREFHSQDCSRILGDISAGNNQRAAALFQQQRSQPIAPHYQYDDDAPPMSLFASERQGLPPALPTVPEYIDPWAEAEYPSLHALQRGGYDWQRPQGLDDYYYQDDDQGLTSLAALESIKPTESLLERNRSDADLPLSERISQWEAKHQLEVNLRKSPPAHLSAVFMKTLTGQTITLGDLNLAGPVADLCMDVAEKGYPLCTQRVIYNGVIINEGESLHEQMTRKGYDILSTTTLHLVRRLNTEKLNTVLAGKFCSADSQDEEPLMPARFNSTEKIERVLLKLRRQARTTGASLMTGKPVGAEEFLELKAHITRAREQLIRKSLTPDTIAPGDYEGADTLANYFDTVLHCLDIYQVPFVGSQNSHIDKIITEVKAKEGKASQAIRRTRLADKPCTLQFRSGEVRLDRNLLAARCEYIGSAQHFGNTDKVSFKNANSNNPLAEKAFETYLTSGDLGNIGELPASAIVSLFQLANRYQATELENHCLVHILKAIKYNLFTVQEMEHVVTFMTRQEIQQALAPLIELQAVDQGGGPRSLKSLQSRCRTIPRAPAYEFENGLMSLQLSKGGRPVGRVKRD
ncbi:hypothetical protein EOPP23_14540 [Endozoicomonas sp. OPT23]|uniref:hypothetical protein n=1 Tax=Endozoicomonas sp. OPT23 TaxID=2072845 RepID=UPI00129AACD9|nr:hypothetical protein [Endozoicomonas sp. OPT23]MRI34209.1 hypothetical protein [Endozoicomonas sp. OPT23]